MHVRMQCALLLYVTFIFGYQVREGASDEALFLTPLLEAGKIASARNQARVTLDISGVESYAGYLTVDKACQSNLFFWYFPALKKRKNAPVGVWLQGGPGSTSLIGLFEEIGIMVFNGTLHKRIDTWNTVFHLVFIDQPVGTGFSFTGNGCYAENGRDVSKDLYSGINQFFKLFPELQHNSFYLIGQSYGGHYVPAVGSFIHKANGNAKTKINMKGLMIGNGWMDSIYQADYGAHLSDLELYDGKAFQQDRKIRRDFLKAMKQKKWIKAFNLTQNMIEFYFNITGNRSEYDYSKTRSEVSLRGPWVDFVQESDIRKAIHVGNNTFSYTNRTVFMNLRTDYVQSVKPFVEQLLKSYPMIFYGGENDIIAANPMVLTFLRALQWSGAKKFNGSRRQRWCVDNQEVGSWRAAGNLVQLNFKDSSHFVPKDQPANAALLAASVASATTTNLIHDLDKC